MNRKGMMKRLTGLIALLIGVTVSMRAEVSLFLSDCAVERGDTAETDVLSRIIEALKGAVATAREAHQEGDTSVVALSWGTPEPYL